MNSLPPDCVRIIARNLSIDEIRNYEKTCLNVHDSLKDYRNYFSNPPDNLSWNSISTQVKYDLASHNFEKISLNNCCALKHLTYSQSIKNRLTEEIENKLHNAKNFTIGLTHEQSHIRDYEFEPKLMYAIQAFAGTGKTTTLVEVAKQNTNKKILYIAFNKALATEAEVKAFVGLDNVTIYTIHALSLNHTNEKYKVENLTTSKISEFLNIEYDHAYLTQRVLNTYLTSYDKRFNETHLPDNIGRVYYDYALQLWNAMLNKEFPMCHDGYVKLFMISKKDLNYDIVLIDEAQDITYCMFRIIKNQKNATKIFVGDMHQQIYGFRNVCNVIELIPEERRFGLHQSFRYGFELTYIVNHFLNVFKQESKCINPCHKNTIVTPKFESHENYVLVCRSNYTIRKMALEYASKHITFSILGTLFKPEKEIEKITELNSIAVNGFSNHRKLRELNTLEEAYLHFSEIGNEKWKIRIKLFNELGFELYRDNLEYCIEYYCPYNSKVTLTTVHQSKGLEFDNVKIADDFTYINANHIVRTESMKENYNLIYVAMTRAKKKLVLNNSLKNYYNKIYKWNDFPRLNQESMKPLENIRCDECSQFQNVYNIEEYSDYKGLCMKVYKCITCMSRDLAILLNC